MGKIAIPTIANERQFRSRLEATWYYFMRSFGWTACYEPYDLNGWIPDFSIRGEKEEMLVEIKPYYYLEEFAQMRVKIFQAIEGTEKANKEILLLGTAPLREDPSYPPAIGWLGNDEIGPGERSGNHFARAPLMLIPPYNSYTWGFCHEDNGYHDRISGFYDGRPYPPDWLEIEKLWNRAANEAQWKRPNGRP